MHYIILLIFTLSQKLETFQDREKFLQEFVDSNP